MDGSRVLRDVANIVNLSTPLGLLLAAAGRGRARRFGHLLVFDRVRLPVPGAGAMTVGSVVLIFRRSLEEAEARLPSLLHHEEQHSWQWAYCLGLPFLLFYYAQLGWSLWRTGDRAAANFFEVQAGLEAGGYRRRPIKRRLVR